MKQGDCSNIVREIVNRIYGEKKAYAERNGRYPTRIIIGVDLYQYMMLDYDRVVRHPEGKITIMGMEANRSCVNGLIMVGEGTIYEPEGGGAE